MLSNEAKIMRLMDSCHRATTSLLEGLHVLAGEKQNTSQPHMHQANSFILLTEEDDDLEIFQDLFLCVDSDKDGAVSFLDLVSTLEKLNASCEQVEALRLKFGNMHNKINFKKFADIMRDIPRMKGDRIRWSGSIGLPGVLASLLPRGHAFDGLHALRNMEDAEMESHIRSISGRFIALLPSLLRKGLHELRTTQRRCSTMNSSKTSFLSKASCSQKESDIRSKFYMDSAFVGRFGTLEDFYLGPEARLGAPDPNVRTGAEREHTRRPNARRLFTAPNHRFQTCPAEEWEFVVAPRIDRAYPHAPADRTLWPSGVDWQGPRGRDPMELAVLVGNEETKRKIDEARLCEAEVVCLRLYTGPMYVLYNAALRGFPAQDVACLAGEGEDRRGNLYETTIFAIASGVTKLSKITAIPPNRKLYRGLGGMLLPEQFWRTDLQQVHIDLSVRAPNPASALAALEARVRRVSSHGCSDNGASSWSDWLDLRDSCEGTAEMHGDVWVALETPQLTQEPRVKSGIVRLALALAVSRTKFKNTLQVRLEAAVAAAAVRDGPPAEVRVESIAEKPRDFRVELGFLSTTTNIKTAIDYSGLEQKRATVFEIETGRVDVGASIKFLSQYPQEEEYLMPPLSCLEVVGEPRVHRVDADEIVIVPLRINVNLKTSTTDDLVCRRKNLHLSMLNFFREELQYMVDPSVETIENINQDFIVLNSGLNREPSLCEDLTPAAEQVRREFENLADIHESVAAIDFNNDSHYRRLMTEAIDAKSLALLKVKVYAQAIHAQAASSTLLRRILERPMMDFGKPGVVAELRTGVEGFPWAQLESRSATIDVGWWRPPPSHTADRREVVRALWDHDNLRYVKVGSGLELFLPLGCDTKELLWDRRPAVSTSPEVTALMLECCTALSRLSLRGNNLGVQGWNTIMDALEELPALTNLNGVDVYGPLRIGGMEMLELVGKDLAAREAVVALARLLPKNKHTLTTLDMRFIHNFLFYFDKSNGLNALDGTVLALALPLLTGLVHLDIRRNSLGEGGALALSTALGCLNLLARLTLCSNGMGPRGAAMVAAGITGLKNLRHLGLGANNLMPGGGVLVAGFLSALGCLFVLDFGNNDLFAEGSAAVSYALRSLSNLARLDLCNNHAGKGGGRALSEALPFLPRLSDLGLGWNHLGLMGGLALASTLSTTSFLTRLDLRSNEFGAEVAAVLAAALPSCQCLRHLALGSNPLGPEGMTALQSGLLSLVALEYLDLSDTELLPSGCSVLACLLPNLTTLAVLSLKSNQLNAESISFLAGNLTLLTGLTQLDFGRNKLCDAGARALAPVLDSLSVLSRLVLTDNAIGPEARQEVRRRMGPAMVNLRLES